MSSIPTQTPALEIHAVGKARLTELPVAAPGPDQLLIEVSWSGVSAGTEGAMAAGKTAPFGPMPFMAGYQAVGVVVAVGELTAEDPAAARVGDLVACFAPGAHSKFVMASRDFTHVLQNPDAARAASLFVQAATAANALARANVQPGHSVLVTGLGIIGQSVAALARLRGADVIGSDISPSRREMASAYCADIVVDPSNAPVHELVAQTHPSGVDVVVETTGLGAVIDDGMSCLKVGGTFAFLAVYPEGFKFGSTAPQTKQVTAVFPWFIGDRANRDSVLRLIESGDLPVESLISHSIAWSEADAFYADMLGSGGNQFNGVVIDWR